MFTRAMATATALLLSGTVVSAQMPKMEGGTEDGMSGMMDQQMMMGGMMQGMMPHGNGGTMPHGGRGMPR